MNFYIVYNKDTREVLCVCLDKDYADGRKIDYMCEGMRVGIYEEQMLTIKDGKIVL